MRTQKLHLRMTIEHEVDSSNRLFDPLVSGMIKQDPDFLHKLIVKSLRSPEHAPLWRGAHIKINIDPEWVDDSVGKCCATCSKVRIEDHPVCRYNQSSDLSLCCDLHEWSPELLVRAESREEEY